MMNKTCDLKKIAVWKNGLLSSLFLIVLSSTLFAQDLVPASVFKSQGGIEITIDDHDVVQEVLQHEGITVDHGCTHHKAKLYVTKEGYEYLIDNNYAFNYVERPPVVVEMRGPQEIFTYKGDCMPPIDYYPTYEGYVAMMNAFAEQYPDLCEVVNIGTLESGRQLLAAHIGDDINESDNEPKVLYTSTMHGDETAGFPLMLQLIDYLLCNYDNDDQIRQLLDEVDIYINPLANPDGTYTDDNSTVDGATRRNANFIDLNRNYPDPEDGTNPDNRATQLETKYFIDFAEEIGFDLSCNIHGGAEVVNYPWDTWAKTSADESWWVETCREFADSCQINSVGNYMTDYYDGITNGYDWYEVNGGRQDNMIYFYRGREMTLEISGRKLLNSDRLPEHWEANRGAFISYIKSATYGLKGTIKDCETGEPIVAEVFLEGHDRDNSSVFSDARLGNYFRFLDDGVYSVRYTAEGYDTVYRSVTIFDDAVHIEDIELCAFSSSVSDSALEQLILNLNGDRLYISGAAQIPNLNVSIYSAEGRVLRSNKEGTPMIDLGELAAAVYYVKLEANNKSITRPIVKQ